MAEWIEAIAGDRVGDQAEVLVHHYTQALSLAKASGDAETQNLTEPTLRFLILAGDRAMHLDVAKAGVYYRRALELLPSGHRQRAPTLLQAGRCARHQGFLDEGQHYLEEATIAAIESGDVVTQGEAILQLSDIWWSKGDGARSHALTAEAIEVLERQAPGPQLADAYAWKAGELSGQPLLALEWSDKALALARLMHDEKVMLKASAVRSLVRCNLGDLGGVGGLRRAVQDGLRLGHGANTAFAYSGLAEWTWWIEGSLPGAQLYEEYIQFAERRGLMAIMMYHKAEFLRVLFDLGEWEEIVRSASDVLRWSEDHGDHQTEVTVLLNQAQVLLFRGRTAQTVAIQERLIGLAREIGELQVLVPALAIAALVKRVQNHTNQAVALIDELDQLTGEHHGWRARYLPTAVRVLISADRVDRAEKFLSGMKVNAARDQHSLLAGQALVAEAGGRIEKARDLYREVAWRWADFGFVLEEGQAHLGLARCLLALGDHAAVAEPLHKARAIFKRLGARPLLDEVDRTSAKATALTS